MIKAARISVLVLLLAGSAQAGYIPNGSAQPNPTPTPQQPFVEEEPVEDENPDEAMDALAETALSVLNIALALL